MLLRRSSVVPMQRFFAYRPEEKNIDRCSGGVYPVRTFVGWARDASPSRAGRTSGSHRSAAEGDVDPSRAGRTTMPNKPRTTSKRTPAAKKQATKRPVKRAARVRKAP